MNLTVKSALIFFLLTAAAVYAHGFYYYTVLPDVPLASRFDAKGVPSAYSSRETTIIIYLGIVSLIALAVAAIIFIPMKSLNLPNRDYWVVPERQEQAKTMYKKSVIVFLGASNIYLLGTMHALFRFNMGDTALMNLFWPMLCLYWIFVLIWLFYFYRQFKTAG